MAEMELELREYRMELGIDELTFADLEEERYESDVEEQEFFNDYCYGSSEEDY